MFGRRSKQENQPPVVDRDSLERALKEMTPAARATFAVAHATWTTEVLLPQWAERPSANQALAAIQQSNIEDASKWHSWIAQHPLFLEEDPEAPEAYWQDGLVCLIYGLQQTRNDNWEHCHNLALRAFDSCTYLQEQLERDGALQSGLDYGALQLAFLHEALMLTAKGSRTAVLLGKRNAAQMRALIQPDIDRAQLAL
jgi:hypothetical protein